MPEEALDMIVTAIDRAATRIARREGADAELRHLRTYLIGLLELTARDPGMDAAADDLYAAARAFVGAHPGVDARRDPRQVRLLDEAYRRFRDRLPSRTTASTPA